MGEPCAGGNHGSNQPTERPEKDPDTGPVAATGQRARSEAEHWNQRVHKVKIINFFRKSNLSILQIASGDCHGGGDGDVSEVGGSERAASHRRVQGDSGDIKTSRASRQEDWNDATVDK